MRQWNEVQVRCLSVVEALNHEQGWALDRAAQIQYVLALRPYLVQPFSDQQLRAFVLNYHADHTMVEALQNRAHPQHLEAWKKWMREVIPVLQSRRLQWSSDIAVDIDDLAQMALTQIARSIGSYGYRSKLSTWIFRVIILSTQRHLRSQHAAKRAVRPDSLQQFPSLDAPIVPQQHPETQVRARLLVEQCMQILAAHSDRRLAAIFYLWAAEERRIEEIGAMYQLHPSRVGTLLREIKSLLQNHPDLQAWRSAEGTQ